MLRRPAGGSVAQLVFTVKPVKPALFVQKLFSYSHFPMWPDCPFFFLLDVCEKSKWHAQSPGTWHCLDPQKVVFTDLNTQHLDSSILHTRRQMSVKSQPLVCTQEFLAVFCLNRPWHSSMTYCVTVNAIRLSPFGHTDDLSYLWLIHLQ